MTAPVMAYGTWLTNAELIRDVARLGYLPGRLLDATHGFGTFWQEHRPNLLVAGDLNPSKAPDVCFDFTALPFRDRTFDSTVFDPPYKLNGRPTEAIDYRYGVDQPSRWQERMALCEDGIRECARVTATFLLVKCMNQVVSGKVRWQALRFAEVAEEQGFGLVDMFHFPSYRAQPGDRRQVTARQNASQLLVLRRGWEWR